MLKTLTHSVETIALAISLLLLGSLCLAWTIVAIPLFLLPQRIGRTCGRWGIFIGFRTYVWSLQLMQAYRFDLSGLHEIQDGPMILASNHPSLIDALLVVAHNPNVSCVMKANLMNNIFIGVGSRLAKYIRNDSPRKMIVTAVEELKRGGIVLLFPEGTRSTRAPINELGAGVGIIAKYAKVPVQTLIIEQDSAFLSKGWNLFRPPRLPIRYRVRLGRRFAYPTDVRAFTVELEGYFCSELVNSTQNRWIQQKIT